LKGVAWMMAFRVFDRVAGIVSILVLARLLLPEHFGVVALATGVVAFIELLSSLGLDTILIQKRDPTRDHYDTAWTIQLCIALVCALLLCAAAAPAGVFFREPRLEPVIYALALGLAFDGLVNIRIVDFRREMRFDKEFIFMGVRRMVAVIVTVAAAFILRNEWALAIGLVSSRATGLVLSYVMRPAMPRLTLSMRRELLGHSTWLFLSNIVLFVRQRAAEFVLGRTSGATSVGLYLLASDLANTLSQELVSPINRVALPDLAAQNSPEGVARRFDLLTGQLAIVLTPMCVGLAACAGPTVALLFGPSWSASADVLGILAIAGWIAALASNVGVGFLSLGLYRVNAAIHAFGVACLLPLLITGAYLYGPVGAALAVLIANTLTVLAALFASLRATGYGPLQFAGRIWRPTVAAAAMYAAVWYVNGQTPEDWPAVLRLAVDVVAGALVYPIALALLFFLRHNSDAAELLFVSLVRRVAERVLKR
jgi:lipopolysaccharide exporter